MEKTIEINLDYYPKGKGFPNNYFILSSRAIGNEETPIIIYPTVSHQEPKEVYDLLERVFRLTGCLNRQFKFYISDSAKRGLGEEKTRGIEQRINSKNRGAELIRKATEKVSFS